MPEGRATPPVFLWIGSNALLHCWYILMEKFLTFWRMNVVFKQRDRVLVLTRFCIQQPSGPVLSICYIDSSSWAVYRNPVLRLPGSLLERVEQVRC